MKSDDKPDTARCRPSSPGLQAGDVVCRTLGPATNSPLVSAIQRTLWAAEDGDAKAAALLEKARKKHLPLFLRLRSERDKLHRLYNEARAGKDAENPLLNDLSRWRAGLWLHSKQSPQTELRAVVYGPSEWPDFFEQTGRALLNRDAEFFREVARLLETRADVPHESAVAAMMLQVYLNPNNAPEEQAGTKTEVKEITLFWLAFERLKSRPGGWNLIKDNPAGPPNPCFLPETYEAIATEQRRLPPQDWKRLWRRTGLADLPPGGRRGRPPGSRNGLAGG